MIKFLIMAFVGTSCPRLKLPGRQLRSFPGAESLGVGREPLPALSPPVLLGPTSPPSTFKPLTRCGFPLK